MYTLREIRTDDVPGARALVLDILNQEYRMGLSLDELPDIKDIYQTYRLSGEGNYRVALCDGEIVGSIGILRLSGCEYELRRMYVDRRHRGHGIAQKLLDILLEWSEDHDIEAI